MTVEAVTHRATRPSRSPRVRHDADSRRVERTHSLFLRASVATNPAAKARALDEVVLENLAVADHLARRYYGRGIPSEDLAQVARLGLVQAVHRFDLTTGSEFLSYAVPTILGELKRHFRDRGWAIRPPRRIQELRPMVTRATAALTCSLLRPPTQTEIADFLGLDTASVEEALAADGCFIARSLDQPMVGNPRVGVTWAESLGGVDRNLESAEFRMTLAAIFRKLPERDQLVLRLRLADDMTQTQIGSVVGITQVQVSRILAGIKKVLRLELAGWLDVGPRPS
jgi:RNA polymerase sigma-B factor